MGSPSSEQESKQCKQDLESCNSSKKTDQSASGVPENQDCKPDLRRCTSATKIDQSASGAPENQDCKPDLGRRKRATKRKRSESSAPENQHKKLDLSRRKRSKKTDRPASGSPEIESKRKKADPQRSMRATKTDQSASGAPENQDCKPDLRRCTRAKKRKRSESSTPENQHKKRDPSRRKRSKKTDRPVIGSPESKCKKWDPRRRKRATKRERLGSGAPENHCKKTDIGGIKTAKKRLRSTGSAQEGKRCKLDPSGTSAHKTELQTSRRRSAPRRVEDEEACHLTWQRGDVLNARYEVVYVLGQGSYGKVVECIDHEMEGRHVAVKIVENVNHFSRAAHNEIRVLEDLKASDPSNAYHCVQMLEWFEYRGHICIVFELLGLSTYVFMRDRGFLPFSLDDIRYMAYQICTSVNFLHMNKLTHADLKPDNIVFVKSDYIEEYNLTLKRMECRQRKPDIRLVDFGCATYNCDYHGHLVTTRPYRAPEMILELGWSQPLDVWSIGCTLLEYYLGHLVFQTGDDAEHLAMMERLLGPLPQHMIERVISPRKKNYFCNGRLVWDEHSAAGQYVSRCCKPLKAYMTCYDCDHENLFDLIEKMLQYDPAKRITLEEALEHPFFLPLKS